MNWQQLLSLKRFGDTQPRLRKLQDETRLGFEVDYDRIIFSSAFRSLQDKTQVVPMPITVGSSREFVHTRLTHSLEVSVVGRSLGRIAGKKILGMHPELAMDLGYKFNDFGAIVAAASLAHDIGNPPFGHSGEKAIGAFFESGNGAKYQTEMTEKQFRDLVDFEGNANGLKLLTESRNGVEGGLRLSYATLGAFMKYPKESLPLKPSTYISDKKFGFFQSDVGIFKDLVQELGLLQKQGADSLRYHRHPLTYLVEAADDICYTIIDFEDGINLGLISEDYALEYFIKLVKDRINTKKYNQLETMRDRLSYLRALAINTLINDAIRVFEENENNILSGNFEVALLDKSRYEAQINDIIGLSVSNIYQSNEVLEKELAGYKIIAEILEVVTSALMHQKNGMATSYDALILKTLPKEYCNGGSSTYRTLLNAACYVASLSDSAAVHLHQTIMGRKL